MAGKRFNRKGSAPNLGTVWPLSLWAIPTQEVNHIKDIRADLPNELPHVNLHVLADLHIGAPECNMGIIQQRIAAIKDDPHAYAILNGDLINNATRNSVSDVYAEKLSPMEQVKQCVDTLEPIKERILAATSGNHCFRSYKSEGIDIMHFVCAELGLVDNYDFDGVLLFLRFGINPKAGLRDSGEKRKLCYTIYCTHGSGGGRTVGAKANALQRRGEIVNADVCVVGHTHTPMTYRDCELVADKVSSTSRMKETVYVNTGSTLAWGGYSERIGLKPSSTANPVIGFSGDRFEIEVRI